MRVPPPPPPPPPKRLPRLQCFSHFTLYLKGREELVMTIYHGLLSPRTPPPIHKVSTVRCGMQGGCGGGAAQALCAHPKHPHGQRCWPAPG
jgi:hypothetical protein